MVAPLVEIEILELALVRCFLNEGAPLLGIFSSAVSSLTTGKAHSSLSVAHVFDKVLTCFFPLSGLDAVFEVREQPRLSGHNDSV